MSVFVPIAAAIAVIVAIGLSVALPRLLTDASPKPAAPEISAPPPDLTRRSGWW